MAENYTRPLCVNKCGKYGLPSLKGMCLKCYTSPKNTSKTVSSTCSTSPKTIIKTTDATLVEETSLLDHSLLEPIQKNSNKRVHSREEPTTGFLLNDQEFLKPIAQEHMKQKHQHQQNEVERRPKYDPQEYKLFRDNIPNANAPPSNRPKMCENPLCESYATPGFEGVCSLCMYQVGNLTRGIPPRQYDHSNCNCVKMGLYKPLNLGDK